MGKVIALVIVLFITLGSWYFFSQTSEQVTPTTETVNEPINEARDLEDRATNPTRGTLSD